MLGQSTPISYHTEANGCIFFGAGVGMKNETNQFSKGKQTTVWSLLLEMSTALTHDGISSWP